MEEVVVEKQVQVKTGIDAVMTKEEMAKFADKVKKQIPDEYDSIEDPKAVLEKYLSDPSVRENAAYWANFFNSRFNGNWFNLEKIIKKTQFKNVRDAEGMMQVIALSGFCHVTNKNGKAEYKITLDPADKIMLLESDKKRLANEKEETLKNVEEQYQVRLMAIDYEIERLKKK